MSLEFAEPLGGDRPFHGLGVQADAYLFDDANRAWGVTDADIALVERRLRALAPAVARLFVEVPWFNPSLDGTTFVWDQPGHLNLVRQLRLLQELGTRVNLVLFQPMFAVREQMRPAAQAMLALLERLPAVEDIRNVRWLTLWNEPESLFPHDSPLARRIFGEKRLQERPPWDEYVRVNRDVFRQLGERGLHPQVRLAVPDCVWGAPMRRERMELATAAFADLDVDYSYHQYNPEDPAFYAGNPDYAYPGMATEAAAFRELVGPERTLMIWEFNTTGIAGFGSHFPGVGPAGVDQVSSVAGAVDVAAKVLTAASRGIDGFCLWCLHDMVYCGRAESDLMHFGLWRYRTQQWLPRPLYHYYALLMQTLRPGLRLRRVTGVPDGLLALGFESASGPGVVLLNPGLKPAPVDLVPPVPGTWRRRRVHPRLIPAAADLPACGEEALSLTEGGALALALEPAELTVVLCPGPAAESAWASPTPNPGSRG